LHPNQFLSACLRSLKKPVCLFCPQTFILKMHPASSTQLPPTGEINQVISIKNPTNVSGKKIYFFKNSSNRKIARQGVLRMRLRICYSVNGQAVTEQAEVNQFSPTSL